MSNLKASLFIAISFLSQNINAQFECVINDTTSATTSSVVPCNEIDISLDEILLLPEITFKLAFHSMANSNNENFTCDPNDPIISTNWHLYFPNTINSIVNKMNEHMDIALLLNGAETNVRINFELTR
jgi:hypothetical protein